MKMKTVLITGASRGIGKAIALRFAAEGYHIFLNANKSINSLENVKELIETNYHTNCTLVPGDVGNPDDVRKIFSTIAATHKGLDVLINNAGIAYMGLLTDMTDEEWDQIIQTNLSSVFYCCRAALPHMISQKKGRIINISSMWGTSGASCEAAYSATKAGVHGLTKALAKELAPSNIQVNAIACGVIDTAMNQQLSEEDKIVLKNEIPASRFGTPEEVAEVVLQLATSPGYLTGQIIGVDGGYL